MTPCSKLVSVYPHHPTPVASSPLFSSSTTTILSPKASPLSPKITTTIIASFLCMSDRDSPLEMQPPSPAPPNAEAQLFVEQDLEFRCITTLLHILGSRDTLKLENFQVSVGQRPYLKLLSLLSSLLVRDHEILAILPKSSGRLTELFVSSEKELPVIDDSFSSSSSSSPSFSYHYITRNPRYDDPGGSAVEFLATPELDVGLDVLSFILANWNQSFDCHVKAFENLLNKCLADLSPSTAWNNLGIYSLFQSVQKIYRRFRRSPSISTLKGIDTVLPYTSTFLDLTEADRNHMRMIFVRNQNAKEIHQDLYNFVTSRRSLEHLSAEDLTSFLSAFHAFFKWFLAKIWDQILILRKLRMQTKPPEVLPQKEIRATHTHLKILCYFAWKSDFFAAYVRTALRRSTDINQNTVFDIDETNAFRGRTGGSERETGEKEEQEEENEATLDIPTEFDTNEGQPVLSSGDALTADRCISELRLITANIQHLNHLENSRRPSKKLPIKFQILKYPCCDQSMKPWQEVVADLFDKDTGERVMETLDIMSTAHKKFADFNHSAPPLLFKGQAHCEAVLGCLYSLANDDSKDNSWANISPDLLRTIGRSYNLLATSKRCCPVCATTISLLSSGDHRNPLQALSRHSIIFPCAFPPGLRQSVREQLLKKYRRELHDLLLGLIGPSRRFSNDSGQSEPLSEHEARRDVEGLKGLMNTYLEMLEESEEGEERKETWEEMVSEMGSEMAIACWEVMSEELRVGLRPPG